MRAPLEIATNAQKSSRMRYQLYYFLLLTEATPHGNTISLDDFRTFLAHHGTTPATIKRAIYLLQQPFGKDGRTTSLVRMSHDTMRPVAVAKIAEDLGFVHLGWVHFTDADMRTYETYKPALYDVTMLGARRDIRGGVTGARSGFTKLSGVSASTQRKYERQRKIKVQANYAIVVNSAKKDMVVPTTGEVVQVPIRGVLVKRYGPGRMRPDIDACAVRKASTYISQVAMTSQLAQTYTVVEGIPAKNQRVLEPEYGTRSMRHNFEQTTLNTYNGLLLCDILETGNDADVFGEYQLDPKTGKTIGIYYRYMGDPAEDKDDEKCRWRPLSKFQEMNYSVPMP